MTYAEGEALASILVLVVEDEVLILDLICPALEGAGYTVIRASTGDEAVSELKSNAPTQIRAIITDIDLGTRTTGWIVAKRARELHPDVPVIYMTGGSARDWSANGVPNSVLIAKPFVTDRIVTAVSQLLNAAPPAAPSP